MKRQKLFTALVILLTLTALFLYIFRSPASEIPADNSSFDQKKPRGKEQSDFAPIITKTKTPQDENITANDDEEIEGDDQVVMLDEQDQVADQNEQSFNINQAKDNASSVIYDSQLIAGQTTRRRTPKTTTSGNELFTPEDLVQLAQSGADVEGTNKKLLAGATRRRSTVSQPLANQEELVDGEFEDDEFDDFDDDLEYPLLFTGQPRGYAMLYMMHPKARATVERELEIILESGLREVYIGVLVDGTFGLDFPYLTDFLQRLADNERVITLALYLTNGATMRKYQNTPISAPFVRIDPKEFRRLIRSDRNIQEQFVSLARKAKPIVNFNSSLHPENSNIIIVMLEDNLDRDSYRAMRDLAYSVFSNSVEYMRNPCPNCFEGNDTESFGDKIELHQTESISRLSSGDGFTLDGEGFFFPWENASEDLLSIDNVLLAQDRALQRRLKYFGLWRAARQGLGDASIHPDRRHYEVPTEDQAVIEIEILRNGLEPLDEEEFDQYYYY